MTASRSSGTRCPGGCAATSASRWWSTRAGDRGAWSGRWVASAGHLDPRQQQVAQRRRQLGGPPGVRHAGGQQLLGEERVALRAGQDFPDQRGGRWLAEDPGQQLAQLAAAQPAQCQPLGPAAAVQLAKERP